MTILAIPTDRIDPNPYQPRLDEDAEHVAGLAESLRAVGMLQTPLARPHPERAGRVQLAFGHSRLAAWRIAFPDQPFPLETRELSDRQMSDLAAEENSRRKNLSAIETARAIARRMADFGLTQLEAGAPFGYASQGAVANVLRLLKLPESVQARVNTGDLPERHARELIPLAKILPTEAVKIADQVAKAAAGERDAVLERRVDDTLRARAKWFHDVPWALDWPKTPIKVDGHKSLAEIPACKGCEFFVSRRYGADACLRAECFELKRRYAVEAEVERACRRLKIGVSAGDPTTLVFDGDGQEALAVNALATKHESLRLAPHYKDDYRGYDRKRVLGTEWAQLHTTDMAALKKAIAALPKDKKQLAADRHQSDYKRQQKQAQQRLVEYRRLLQAAAPALAACFAWPEPVLDRLIPPMASAHFKLNGTQVRERLPKLDAAGKAQLVAEIVLSDYVGGGYMYSSVTPETARKKIAALAETLKVKLAAGWDAPAVKPNGLRSKDRRSLDKPAPAHVRGHTAPARPLRPAPKPSQKKPARRRKSQPAAAGASRGR